MPKSSKVSRHDVEGCSGTEGGATPVRLRLMGTAEVEVNGTAVPLRNNPQARLLVLLALSGGEKAKEDVGAALYELARQRRRRADDQHADKGKRPPVKDEEKNKKDEEKNKKDEKKNYEDVVLSRLRRWLGDQVVLSVNGAVPMLRLNPRVVSVDLHTFDLALRNAENARVLSEKRDYLRDACNAFRPSLLHSFGVDIEAFNDLVYNHELTVQTKYFNALRELAVLYAAEGNLQDARDCCRKLLPDEERDLEERECTDDHSYAVLLEARILAREGTPQTAKRHLWDHFKSCEGNLDPARSAEIARFLECLNKGQTDAVEVWPYSVEADEWRPIVERTDEAQRTAEEPWMKRGPLVGREMPAADIQRQVLAMSSPFSRVRLLTLVGAPGIGKTSLAEHVSKLCYCDRDGFPGGVVFAYLADVLGPEALWGELARAAGVRASPGRSLSDLVIGYLSKRRGLLVLDNCEGIQKHVRQIVSKVLDNCPRTVILATSREPIGATPHAEAHYDVPALEVPSDLASTYDSPAVQFFLNVAGRTKNAEQRIEPTRANAPDIFDISTRLDGIPLAIEMVAARVKQTPLRELAAEVREHILAAAYHTEEGRRPPHHETLQRTFQWSWASLKPDQKAALCALSLFRQGFTRDAARAIVAAGADGAGAEGLPRRVSASRVLDQLVDRSWVVRPDANGDRYRLLMPIREFARTKIEEAAGAGDTDGEHIIAEHARSVRRYQAYYEAMVSQCTEAELSEVASPVFARFDAEELNVAEYLDRLEANTEEPEALLRACSRMSWYWKVTNPELGYRRLKKAYDLAGGLPPTIAICTAARVGGMLANRLTWYEDAAELLRESLSGLQVCGTSGDIGWGCAFLGATLFRSSTPTDEEFKEAEDLFRRGKDLGEEATDPRLVALCERWLAEISFATGDFDECERHVVRCLQAITDAGGSDQHPFVLLVGARSARARGQMAVAFSRMAECLSNMRGTRDRLAVSGALLECAQLVALGQPEEGARLLAAAVALRFAPKRVPWLATDRTEFLRAARQTLDTVGIRRWLHLRREVKGCQADTAAQYAIGVMKRSGGLSG